MNLKEIFKKENILGLTQTLFKKDYLIGLDIGSTSIKLVQFTKKEDGFYLSKARITEISPADREGFEDSRKENGSSAEDVC